MNARKSNSLPVRYRRTFDIDKNVGFILLILGINTVATA